MTRFMPRHAKLAFLLILAGTFGPNTGNAQVVCNNFKLIAKLTGSTLNLSVDTDLPDNADVMVGVSRSYLEQGKPSTYLLDYFSEKSTVGQWRSKHSISVDNDKWTSALGKRQETMSRIGLGFDVASVSNNMTVSMVVPINQSDPRFGKGNSKLTGKAVRISKIGLRVVEDKVEINYPLNTGPVSKSHFPSLDPLQLEVGQAYIVTRQTPLMPSHSPANPMAALRMVKQIPEAGGFRVLGTFDKKGNRWYRVSAFDQRLKPIGTAWINSVALLGQQLKAQ
jgi:hypothetical protein